MTKTHSLCVASLFVLGLVASTGAQQSNNEEFARRQYDSGMTFMQNKRYADALKDLQAVADSFATTSWADNALLQIAIYQIDGARDPVATQKAIDRLTKDYADSDSAPMAHVIAGRLALTKGRTSADVDTAMASFERVSRLFPGSEGVAAASYYAGETMRLARRTPEALDRYRRARAEFPRSLWAARAAVGAAYCLLQQGNPQNALQETQWVRQQFPGTDPAAEALGMNTIIYRLYVRSPAQPPYAFSGRFIGAEKAGYSDVVGVRAEPDGRLLLGYKAGVVVFDAKDVVTGTIAANEPSSFFVDEKHRVVIARSSNLIADKGETLPIFMPDRDGKMRYIEDIPAVVITSKGDRLVSDPDGRAVIRVGSDGKYIGPFAQVAAARIGVNSLEDVALLDRSAKSIVLSDRDGKALSKIPPKGTGYEFDNPVDLAFDVLDHLYILDRGQGAVLVFNGKNRLVTTLAIPEKAAGAFTSAAAFSLDRTGRLFIFDERVKRIQVYQ